MGLQSRAESKQLVEVRYCGPFGVLSIGSL